jgi:hypothetical protein
MREDAARVQWAEDYEFLRERARAHIGDGPASTAPSRHVRVISSSRPAAEPEAPRRNSSPERRPQATRAPAPRSYGSRRGVAPPRPEAPRRSVTITGQPHAARRRSPALARVAMEPDRTALWAVMLGIFLALIAVATAHAAPPAAHAHAAAAVHAAAAPHAR